MSGYFGMLRTDGVTVQEDFLQGITRSLAFRGPDGSCIQAKDALGFSFSFRELGPPARRAPSRPLQNPRTRTLFFAHLDGMGRSLPAEASWRFFVRFVGCRGEILLLRG
jgi:hypothetical protein